MNDTVITVENLSKRYFVGHQAAQREHTSTLRDVIVREARNFVRNTTDLVRGRQIIQGDDFEEFWALRDVSFDVKRGEVLGIIGKNGAGKSTLLKIMSRIVEPTQGELSIRGRVASLLEVGTGFHSELTGRENIFINGAILGMTKKEIRSKFDEIVAFAEVEKFLDTPVKRYSSGMYVRLAFAVAAHLEPEILIVDEVLAVGDSEFQRKCLGKMSEVSQRDKRTVLVVSHNLDIISRLCDRSLWIHQGSIKMIANTPVVLSQFQAQQRGALHSSWSRPSSWQPHYGIGIAAVDVFDQNGSPNSSFLFGQTFIVKVTLLNQTGSSMRCFAGIEFATEEGYSLTTTHSNDCGEIGSIPSGDTVLECCVKPNPFMPGRYRLQIGLVDYVGTLIDHVDPELSIEIENIAVDSEQFLIRRPGKIVAPLVWTKGS